MWKCPGKIVLLEELVENAGFAERITALTMSWLMPASLLEQVAARQPEEDGSG